MVWYNVGISSSCIVPYFLRTLLYRNVSLSLVRLESGSKTMSNSHEQETMRINNAFVNNGAKVNRHKIKGRKDPSPSSYSSPTQLWTPRKTTNSATTMMIRIINPPPLGGAILRPTSRIGVVNWIPPRRRPSRPPRETMLLLERYMVNPCRK